MMVMLSSMALAQGNRQKVSREQLAEMQARHIARQLAFDDATTAKYVTTYCEYQKEVWALGPRIKRSSGNEENAIRQRFERSQQILSLREKYYNKYSKFLTQKQIERAYELERKAQKRIQHSRKNKTMGKVRGK